MPAPKVRGNYAELNQIAQSFRNNADQINGAVQRIKQAQSTLQSGDWVGKGATTFYGEMDTQVLPALQRLVNALQQAGQVTGQISTIVKLAEDDAAAVFRLDDNGENLTKPLGDAITEGLANIVSGLLNTLGLGPSQPQPSLEQTIRAMIGTQCLADPSPLLEAIRKASPDERQAVLKNPELIKMFENLGSLKGDYLTALADGLTGRDEVLGGNISVKDAPDKIALPDGFNQGMQEAWKESLPGGHSQEQGGLLVQDKNGQYKWIRGAAGASGTWPPNYQDLGENKLVGLGHTHPYDASEGSFTDVPFSDTDLSFLFKADPNGTNVNKVMMVQSGDTQFVITRTEEFNQLLVGKSDAEVQTIVAEMRQTYNDAAQANKSKPFAERYQLAVKAVADKYNLAYYKGKDGSLTKQ